MRPTVEGLTPTSLASDLRLQCVAPAGLAVSVSLTIRERIEAAIGAIRPGRSLILENARQPHLHISLPPASNLSRILPQPDRNFLVFQAIGRQQDHRRSFLSSHRTLPAPSKVLQRYALLDRQFNACSNSHPQCLA